MAARGRCSLSAVVSLATAIGPAALFLMTLGGCPSQPQPMPRPVAELLLAHKEGDPCVPWADETGCHRGAKCIPTGRDTGYCVIAGHEEKGQICSPTVTSYDFTVCALNNICLGDSLEAEAGTCHEFCLPYEHGGNGSCPGGEFCQIRSNFLGFCTDLEMLGLDEGEPCSKPGWYCEEDVPCFNMGEFGTKCMRLCDLAEPYCPMAGTECSQILHDETLGACINLGEL